MWSLLFFKNFCLHDARVGQIDAREDETRIREVRRSLCVCVYIYIYINIYILCIYSSRLNLCIPFLF